METAAVQNPIERITVYPGLDYEQLVTAFEAELGVLDPALLRSLVMKRAAWTEVQDEVGKVSGPHGLMIIAHPNQGAITSLSGKLKKCSLYLVGNPVVAKDILDADLSASLYVPFRVCVYDNGDPRGAAISYDLPSSSLGTLNNATIDTIAKTLDGKMEAVIASLAKS